MIYKLEKDWVRDSGKISPKGKELDITPELAQWLDDNGYGKPKNKKKIKINKDGGDNSTID
jgi:hypothetical protein